MRVSILVVMIQILVFSVVGGCVATATTATTATTTRHSRSNTTIARDHENNDTIILPNFSEYHVSGVGSVEAEVLCPPGDFPTNSTNCEPCPIGTYNPFEGAPNQDFCMECRAGSYNNQTGTFLMFC